MSLYCHRRSAKSIAFKFIKCLVVTDFNTIKQFFLILNTFFGLDAPFLCYIVLYANFNIPHIYFDKFEVSDSAVRNVSK